MLNNLLDKLLRTKYMELFIYSIMCPSIITIELGETLKIFYKSGHTF